MFKLFTFQSKFNQSFALTLCLSTIVASTSLNWNSVSAKPYQSYNSRPYSYPRVEPTNNNPETNQRRILRQYSQAVNLPAGSTIPVIYEGAEKILVTKDESMAITVKVYRNVTNDYGEIVIPAGSEIRGEIQPAQGGSVFVAESLILPNNLEIPLVASSKVITRTETIEAGKNTDAIWQGAVAGAAAATIIAAVTGDTAIATEEVLGGAGVGALAGFLFGGNDKNELISIDTQRDLDLTLEADLVY